MELTLHYDYAALGSIAPRNNQGPTPTFTRTSEAKSVNKDGWLFRVLSGEPCMYEGIHTENLYQASREPVLPGGWSLITTTITPNHTENPYTGAIGSLVSNNDGAGASFHYISQAIDELGGNQHYSTQTFDVKYVSGSGWVWVLAQGNNFYWFNVLTGTIGGASNSNWVYRNIKPLMDGWYRITLTHLRTSGTFNHGLGVTIADNVSLWDSTGAANQEQVLVSDAGIENADGAWTAANYVANSNNFSLWTQRGSVGFTGGQPDPNGGNEATLITNLTASGNDDFYIGTALGASGFRNWPLFSAFWIKRVSTEGILIFNNTQSGAYGKWDIDMSLLKDEWEYITENHPAVISVIPFKTRDDGSGLAGAFFYRQSGPAPLSFYLYRVQQEPAKPNQTAPGPYLEAGSVVPVFRYPSASASNAPTQQSEIRQRQTGPCRGLQIRREETNLCLNSEDISQNNGGAAETLITLTNNVCVAPDGSLSADKMVVTTPGAGVHAYYKNAGLIGTSIRGVFQVYIKPELLDFVAIGITQDSLRYVTVVFQFSTESVTDTQVGGSGGTLFAQGIKHVGCGWYRCWLSGDITTSTWGTMIAMCDSGTPTYTAGRPTYTSVANQAYYVWGYHTHIGNKPTTYIGATEGVSITRSAEDHGSTDVSWYDPSKGTWYVHVERDIDEQGDSTNNFVFEVSDGSSSDRDYINIQGAALVQHWRNGTGSAESQNNTINMTGIEEIRIATSYNAEEANTYANEVGSVANPDTAVPSVGLHNQFDIGASFNNASYFDGIIKEIRYYRNSSSVDQVNNLTRQNPIFLGYDPRKKQKAIDAALWNKAMNKRAKEANLDGDYTPFNNVG